MHCQKNISVYHLLGKITSLVVLEGCILFLTLISLHTFGLDCLLPWVSLSLSIHFTQKHDTKRVVNQFLTSNAGNSVFPPGCQSLPLHNDFPSPLKRSQENVLICWIRASNVYLTSLPLCTSSVIFCAFLIGRCISEQGVAFSILLNHPKCADLGGFLQRMLS